MALEQILIFDIMRNYRELLLSHIIVRVCKFALPTLLTLFASHTLSHAETGLVWTDSVIEQSASPTDESVTAKFVFRNASAQPIEIKKVVSTCKCLTANASSALVDPGQTGQILANFAIGERTGPQVKKIVIQTNQPGPPDLLTMRVNIPEAPLIRPKHLEWKVGDPSLPQTITIDLKQPGLQIVSFASTSPAFTTDLKRQDSIYQLSVKPNETSQRADAKLKITLSSGEEWSLPLKISVK